MVRRGGAAMNRAAEAGDVEERIAGALGRDRYDIACEVAIRDYGPALLGYLRAILPDEGAADEVFSAVWEKVWKGIAGFGPDSTFRTRLYRLASHAVEDFRRRRTRRRTRGSLTTEQSRRVAEVRSSAAAHQKSDVDNKLARLRERLAPAEHDLLTLRVSAGLSWAEIAGVLGIAEGEPARRKRFARLKAKLQRLARAEIE